MNFIVFFVSREPICNGVLQTPQSQQRGLKENGIEGKPDPKFAAKQKAEQEKQAKEQEKKRKDQEKELEKQRKEQEKQAKKAEKDKQKREKVRLLCVCVCVCELRSFRFSLCL